MEEKLKQEFESVKSSHSQIPAKPILNFLISKAKKEEEFAEKLGMENKSLNECFTQVLKDVKKKIKSNAGWIDDEVVYKMAVDYYLKEEPEVAPEPDVSSEPVAEPVAETVEEVVAEPVAETVEETVEVEPEQEVKEEEETACSPTETVPTMTMNDYFTESEETDQTEETQAFEQISLF